MIRTPFLASSINSSKHAFLSSSELDLLDNVSIPVVEACRGPEGKKGGVIGGGGGGKDFVA